MKVGRLPVMAPGLGLAVLLLLAGSAACDGDDDGSSNEGEIPAGYKQASLVRGGQLYDIWWKVPAVRTSAAPTTDNPGYAHTQGTATGTDTWRCKECHGWDYRGVAGAYASGAHATGVAGLLIHATHEPQELFSAIRDGEEGTAMSAFGQLLSDKDLWDLVKFLREGQVNLVPLIDATTKAPIGADAAQGRARYDGTCATCHGADGKTLNFGSETEPEFVQHIAADNPWEFQHKVRFGQPGEEMPAALSSGWTMKDVLDTMAHVRTLPRD